MERPRNEKEGARLENLKLFNVTEAKSVKSEKMGLGFSACHVILGKLPDLSKLFKSLSLSFLTCIAE